MVIKPTPKPVRVLLPIHLDRWQHPIASKLREFAINIPDFDFYSFSSPSTNEDAKLSERLWLRPNIHLINYWQIASHRYDIVHHASATPANITAALIARARNFGRTTHVYTASTPPHTEHLYTWEYRLSIHIADRVLAISHNVAQAIGADLGRMVDGVVTNGVDSSFFDPMKARSLEWIPDTPRGFFLFVGALMEVKRPYYLLTLAERMPERDFIMVGRRPSGEWVNKLLQRIEDVPNVHYLGLVEKKDVRDLMAQAIALIFPSQFEGFPNSILEASAMGLPVLAQPRSSLVEVVEEGINGWLVSLDNTDEWLERMKGIADWGSTERQSFASQSRQWAIKNHSWEKVAAIQHEYYLRFVREGR